MLNLTINKLRYNAKKRNIDGQKGMSRKKLKDQTDKPSPIKRKSIINIDNCENTSQDYKPKKVARNFNDKYVQLESVDNDKLSIKQYFKKIKPYLINMINDLKVVLKYFK